jgi:DNA-binding transcriptional MerR regulator
MTIDDLARAAGTTTRNVRAYQTRGLLPGPAIVGRVGYYTDDHLARLRLIAKLQEQGFSLAAISRLLAAWTTRQSLSDLLGFEEALTAPWAEEGEDRIPVDRFREDFPLLAGDPSLLRRAVDLGVVVRDGDDYIVPNPPLFRIGAQLVSMGIPVERTLDEFEALRADTAEIARRFVELFDQFVWLPFVEADMPADRLPELTDVLRRLRPLASEAIASALAGAMAEAVSAATAGHLAQLGRRETAAG